MQVARHDHAIIRNVRVSVLQGVRRRCESNLKIEGYLFKHTYLFVLIDSVSFRAYQITVPADKHVLATLNY